MRVMGGAMRKRLPYCFALVFSAWGTDRFCCIGEPERRTGSHGFGSIYRKNGKAAWGVNLLIENSVAGIQI